MNQPPGSSEARDDEQIRMCEAVANGTMYDPIKATPVGRGVDTKKLLADLSTETDALLEEAIKALGIENSAPKN